MNVNTLNWASILTLLVMALAAAWLVLVEEWAPKHAYGALTAVCLAVLAAVVLGGVTVAGKGNRLEFLQEVAIALKKDFADVFGRSGEKS